MFGNFAAQAGVIANNLNQSPNIIEPTLNWDFRNVLVMDFAPFNFANFNDRPRINTWRVSNGQPDFNYLIYISGGKNILSPAPSGLITERWGDRRTGVYKFPVTSITTGMETIAGIDLFTHPFMLPVNISPPLNEWTIDTSGVTGEIKYQYIFKTGNKYPVINITLDYNPNCTPGGITGYTWPMPVCGENEVILFLGINEINCPTFICIPKNFQQSLVEKGDLYQGFNWGSGPGFAGFGVWNFISGSGSFRNISNSTQNNRPGIGNQSFFMVGSRDYPAPIGHTGTFLLYNNLSPNQSLSLNANYSWFGGQRFISFLTGNTVEDYIFRIEHQNTTNDQLIFNRKQSILGPNITQTITGNAFNKAFTYKVTNLVTGINFETFIPGSQNSIYSHMITGSNINFDIIRGLGFVTNLTTVPVNDQFNYGLYFNDITINDLQFFAEDAKYQTAVANQAGRIHISKDYGINWSITGLEQDWRGVAVSEDGRYQTAVARSGFIYTSDDFGTTWVPQTGGVPNLINTPRGWSDVAMSRDGNIQVAVINIGDPLTESFIDTGLHHLFVSSDYGKSWQPKITGSFIKVAISEDGKYQTACSYVGGPGCVNCKGIVSSDSYGQGWFDVLPQNSWTSVAMSSDGSVQTAVGLNINIHRSTNYGLTWSQVNSTNNKNWYDIDINNNGKYQTAVAYGDGIYVSDDYGLSWNPKIIENPGPFGPLWNSIAVNGNGQYQTAAGLGTKIYISNNYGNNWTPRDDNRGWTSVSLNKKYLSENKFGKPVKNFNSFSYLGDNTFVSSLCSGRNDKFYVGFYTTGQLGNVQTGYVARFAAGGGQADDTLGVTYTNNIIEGLYDSSISTGLYVYGRFSLIGGSNYTGIARLSMGRNGIIEGSIDTTFVPNLIGKEPGSIPIVRSLLELPDGKIIIGGRFRTSLNNNNHVDIVRLNKDGSVDNTFFSLNDSINNLPNGIDVYALCSQPDGKILVGGGGFERLNPNGIIDRTFNNWEGSFRGFNDYVYSIAYDPFVGYIYVGGKFSNYNEFSGPIRYDGLIRLDINGIQGRDFNAQVSPNQPLNGNVNGVIFAEPNGQGGPIIFHGDFNKISSIIFPIQKDVGYISCLNGNGSFTSSFNQFENGANNSITKSARISPSTILLGGRFTTYNNKVANKLVLIHTY